MSSCSLGSLFSRRGLFIYSEGICPTYRCPFFNSGTGCFFIKHHTIALLTLISSCAIFLTCPPLSPTSSAFLRSFFTFLCTYLTSSLLSSLSSCFLFHKAPFLFPKGPKVEHITLKLCCTMSLCAAGKKKGTLSKQAFGLKASGTHAHAVNGCFILNNSAKKENSVIIQPSHPHASGRSSEVSFVLITCLERQEKNIKWFHTARLL